MKLFSEYKGLRKELYILFIGRIMTNMGAMIWPMFTLILSQKLGLSAAKIAFYMLIYSIVSMPINLIGGKLADKFNKKNIIVVCDLISIVSYIYVSMVDVNIQSIVIFAVASLFQSVEWPSYDALVADFTTSADRERAYSLSYLGSNLGLVLSPSIGGILFNNHLNLAFLINGLSILLSTVLIFFFIKNVDKEQDDTLSGQYEREIDDNVSALKYILHNRVVLLFFLACLCIEAAYSMYNYLMPLELSAVHNELGSVFFGTMTSLNCFTVVIFTAIVTKLFRKILDIDKMCIGEILELLGYAIFVVFIKTPIFCYVAMFIFTIGEIFSTLSSSPFLTRRIPASHRGRIISAHNVLISLGTALFQTFIGTIYDNHGSALTWTVVIAVGLIAIAIMIIMKGIDKKEYPALYDNIQQ